MNDTVIKVENLSKQYRIGEHQGYKTFREAIVDATKAPIQALRSLLPAPSSKLIAPGSKAPLSPLSSSDDTIWALKDVSFEVKRGEVIGIIGRNGAGKSTLLKILSKITEPTSGRIQMKGRVGSLLEVGTGFHPELTGHENIYLYGAILGMDRWEVTRKFDEIVAFAELEQFIDTPVKRYSSGMYMRLAFAVAAHLEPEILLVDEVLAVGDVPFQKKCLGKMGDISKEGRTVMFVSHNMATVQLLCENAILFGNGRILEKNSAQKVVRNYLMEDISSSGTIWTTSKYETKIKNDMLTPLRLSLHDDTGDILSDIVSRDQNVYVEFEFDLKYLDANLTIGISLFNQEGIHIFRTLHTDTHERKHPILKTGRNVIRAKIPMEILNEGDYLVVLDGGLYKIKWFYNPVKSDISVMFRIFGGLSESPYWLGGRHGAIAPVVEWKSMPIDKND